MYKKTTLRKGEEREGATKAYTYPEGRHFFHYFFECPSFFLLLCSVQRYFLCKFSRVRHIEISDSRACCQSSAFHFGHRGGYFLTNHSAWKTMNSRRKMQISCESNADVDWPKQIRWPRGRGNFKRTWFSQDRNKQR